MSLMPVTNKAMPRRLATALALVAVFFCAASSFAVADVMRLKRTVVFNTIVFNDYWKDKNASQAVYYYSTWVPRATMEIFGEIPSGSTVSIDYAMPDGKPWFTEDLARERLYEGWLQFMTEPRNNLERQKTAIPATGLFGYTVRIWNEIAGTNDVLMTGKLRVEKMKNDVTTKPNEYTFYMNEDWRLPIGWLWTDPSQDAASPELHLSTWLRGKWNKDAIAGYLMYNGKQIASTKNQYASTDLLVEIPTETRNPELNWTLWGFSWGVVRSARGDRSGAEYFILDENPGEYELKVLENGKLIRAVKFTVGPDGKIVDNGIAKSNNIGGSRIILPVQILGDRDGKWNRDAWKTEAVYFNPLVGFTAQ